MIYWFRVAPPPTQKNAAHGGVLKVKATWLILDFEILPVLRRGA